MDYQQALPYAILIFFFLLKNMNLIAFIHQKAYEKIIHSVRRHPITFIPYIVVFILVLLVPVGVYWLINTMFPTLFAGEIIYSLTIMFAAIYFVAVGLFFYSYFVTFYLDLVIITNDRLIDIEQPSLFARTISEVDLYQIQDVTSEIDGIFPSIFNYGDLIIQTAGTVPRFTAYNVPDPHGLRKLILDLAAEDKKHHQK